MLGGEGYPINLAYKGAAAVAAAALLVSACGAPSTPATPEQSTAPKTTELVPDMSRFLEAGSTTTCHNGGARPCAILIRTNPELSAQYINADPAQGRVDWPLEAYNGQPGDSVTIQCYTANGQTIGGYEGGSSSSDWYEVVVPEQHVANPAVRSSQASVLGWASVEWFNQSSPGPSVPAC